MTTKTEVEAPTNRADSIVDELAGLHARAAAGRAELAQLQKDVVDAQLRLGLGQGAQLDDANQRLVEALLTARADALLAEQTLEDATNYLRQLDDLFELSSDALVKISPDGRVLALNRRAVNLFGPLEDPSGPPGQTEVATVDRLMPARCAGEFQELLNAALLLPASSGMPDEWVELDVRRVDGTEFAAQVGLRWREERDGPVLVAAFDDISERQSLAEALQESLDRYRHTLGNLIEGCMVIDRDWHCRYMNAAAARQANRSAQSLIGRKLPQSCPEITATELFKLCQLCMSSREPQYQEVPAVFPNGLRGWFQVSVLPTPDGILLLSVDISRQKRAEVAIWNNNIELERRVEQRTAELEKARIEADDANTAKTRFLATMSHELRTPMNGIVGMIDVLFHSALPAQHTEAVQTIRNAAFTLLDIVDEILDFSKIEAGRMELESRPLWLAQALRDTTDAMQPIAAKAAVDLFVTIDPALPASVRIDARRLRQILTNLIGNAIKFSSRGEGRVGRVHVSASASAGGGAMTLQIEDDGIGMSPETVAGLYTPFAQADSSITRRFGGSGLGLSICKRLSHLMGGTIEATSEIDRGTRFTVVLPIESTDLDEAEPSIPREEAVLDRVPLQPPLSVEQASAEGRLILVAEDDAVNQLVLFRQLGILGYAAELAHDGDEALSMWLTGRYALLLTDIRMPKRDGFDLARAIRAKESGARRPIIVLTASTLVEDGPHANPGDIEETLIKPLRLHQLATALHRWLPPRQGADAAQEVDVLLK